MSSARPVGHIEQVGEGRWFVKVQRGSGAAGDRRQLSEVVEGARKDAQIRAAAMAAELGRSWSAGDGITLEEYWRVIFPGKLSNRGTPRSKSTMVFYQGAMDRYILPRLGGVRLDRLSHAMIRDCVNAAGSPTNCKRTLSAVLRCAYDDGLMPEKPFDRRVPVHRRKKAQVLPWNRFEASTAISSLQTASWEVRTYLALGLSGLRECEVLGARPMDVRQESTYSFATGERVETVTVTVAQTYTDKGGLVPRAKNETSLRSVPVLPSARDMLADAIAESRASAEDPGSWAASRLLDLSGSQLIRLWRRALADAGLRYIPPDMLRHTSDTLALTAGVGADLNDKMHGRSNHSATYQNYFRPDLGVMDSAARRIDGLLCGQNGGDSDSCRTLPQ